jgi:phage baseplate assembly protein W
MIGYSPKFPLELDNYVGAYSLNTTLLEVAKQNFMNVLLTSPGERLMDPDFGVGLRRYLFEPNTPTLHSSIATKIQKQVAKYTPYIQLGSILFNQSKLLNGFEDQILEVSLDFSVPSVGAESETVIIGDGATAL